MKRVGPGRGVVLLEGDFGVMVWMGGGDVVYKVGGIMWVVVLRKQS